MNGKFEFQSFRRWFNRRFSLSFAGKFKGLSTLVNLYGMRFVENLWYKLYKMFSRTASYSRFYDDCIVLRLGGHIIKLYNR